MSQELAKETWRTLQRENAHALAEYELDKIRDGVYVAIEAAMEGSGADEFPVTREAILEIVMEQVEFSRNDPDN